MISKLILSYEHWKLGLTTILNASNRKNKNQKNMEVVFCHLDDFVNVLLSFSICFFVILKETIKKPPQRTFLPNPQHRDVFIYFQVLFKVCFFMYCLKGPFKKYNKGNPAMTISTVTASRKGSPQHYVEGKNKIVCV